MCKKPTLHYKGSFSKVTATDRRDRRKKGQRVAGTASCPSKQGMAHSKAGGHAVQGIVLPSRSGQRD